MLSHFKEGTVFILTFICVEPTLISRYSASANNVFSRFNIMIGQELGFCFFCLEWFGDLNGVGTKLLGPLKNVITRVGCTCNSMICLEMRKRKQLRVLKQKGEAFNGDKH